jgi:ankyrin repeat protein
VKALLAGKAKIDARTGKKRRTPLIAAIAHDHLAVALHLVEQGADPNLPDLDNGWTPLIWTALRSSWMGQKNLPLARALLKAGADVNLAGTDGITPLMWAASRAGVQFVRLLLARCADVHAVTTWEDNARRNVLTFGCNVAVLRLLLDAGADPKAVDEHGRHTWEFHTGPAADLLKEKAGAR